MLRLLLWATKQHVRSPRVTLLQSDFEGASTWANLRDGDRRPGAFFAFLGHRKSAGGCERLRTSSTWPALIVRLVMRIVRRRAMSATVVVGRAHGRVVADSGERGRL